MRKLTSRKFWMGLIGVLTPLVTQLATGEVGWPTAVVAATAAAVAYITGEGTIDVRRETRMLLERAIDRESHR